MVTFSSALSRHDCEDIQYVIKSSSHREKEYDHKLTVYWCRICRPKLIGIRSAYASVTGVKDARETSRYPPQEAVIVQQLNQCTPPVTALEIQVCIWDGDYFLSRLIGW